MLIGLLRRTALDIYIDLAFDEVANLKAVVSTVHLQGAYEAFDNNVEQLHIPRIRKRPSNLGLSYKVSRIT